MKKLFFYVFFLCGSLFLFSEESALSSESEDSAVEIPLLTHKDFSIPPLEDFALVDQVFPGENPLRGAWGSGIFMAAGIGATAGSLVYTFQQIEKDPFSPEVQQGLGMSGLSLISLGLSSLLLDYFLDIMATSEE